MKKPTKSLHLDFEKNPVNIDYITHDNGMDYIEITETTEDEHGKKKKARISKAQFKELVAALQDFQVTFNKALEAEYQSLTDTEKQTIKKRSAAGATLKELAEELNTTEALIKMVLNEKGLKIRKTICKHCLNDG